MGAYKRPGMQNTNNNISKSLSREDLFLAASCNRVPAVLPYNGVKVDGLSLRQGQVNKTMFAGVFNLWFLRDWASWSLGQDCPEVVDYVPGGLRTYAPGLDRTIPDYYSSPAQHAKRVPEYPFSIKVSSRSSGVLPIGLGGLSRDPADLDREMIVDAPRFGKVWAMFPEGRAYNPDPIKKITSPYKFFSTHAYFDGALPAKVSPSGTEKGIGDSMPLVNVPESDLELTRGGVAYRRTLFEDPDDFSEQDFLDSGYMYRFDKASGLVYYTNSVACYYGLPPVAEALGWPKLQLKPLPEGWDDEVATRK